MSILDSPDCRYIFTRIESTPPRAHVANQAVRRDHVAEGDGGNHRLIDGKNNEGNDCRPGDDSCRSSFPSIR